MKGFVRSLEPIVQIVVRGTNGQRWQINAVIDSGATCELTLSRQLIQDFGLKWTDRATALLAGDGSVTSEVYEAAIEWNGRVRPIVVHEMDGTPLIGMRLLEGFRVLIDVKEGGAVEVISLDQLSQLEDKT